MQRVLSHSPAEAGLAFPPFNLSVPGWGSLIGPRLTEKIGEGAALVEGFRLGFFGAAVIADLGALLAHFLIRGRR